MKTKKIIITIMAVLCALSSSFAMTASAKTTTWKHSTSVSSIKGSTTSYLTANVSKVSRMSDTYSNYPTIFDGYKKSVNKGRCVNTKTGKSYAWKSFTLNSSGGIVTVVYSTAAKGGSYKNQTKHVSYGGFKDNNVIFSRTY